MCLAPIGIDLVEALVERVVMYLLDPSAHGKAAHSSWERQRRRGLRLAAAASTNHASVRLGHSCAREIRVVGFWYKLTPAQRRREMASWAERQVWSWAELRVSVGPI